MQYCIYRVSCVCLFSSLVASPHRLQSIIIVVVVASDVFKALNKTRGLYLRWRELGEANGPAGAAGAAAPASADAEWTTTELRNSLRSIEWDLEDLEDTINILFRVSR